MGGRFRLVLLALTASAGADAFLLVAESFAVLRVTGSAGKLGLVLAFQSAVALLLTLAGGVAADRFPRGRILCVSLAARTVISAVVGMALLTGTASFGLLLGMAGLYGCADGFFGPASTALLPAVVSRTQLAAANSLIGGFSSSARIIAPAMAGVIVGTLGPGPGFVFQAGMLAVASVGLAAVRINEGRAAPGEHPGLLSQLRVGWAEFTRLRWLWLLTGQWTVFSLLVLAPVAVLGPAIAERYLGGATAWGIISSCLALGSIGGQLAAGRIRPSRPAFAIACLVPIMTTEALALGLGAPLGLTAAAAAVSGCAMGAEAVILQTAMQVSVPPAALARVSAFDLLGSECGQPVGYALAGPIGMAVGPRAFLAASAIGMFVAATAFTVLRPLQVRVNGIAAETSGDG